MRKVFFYDLVKILLYEVIKFALASAACFVFFTLIPLSVYLLLLPLDLISWYVTRKKVEKPTWAGITFLVYLAVVFFSVWWVMSGREGLEFLLDFDRIF